MKITPLTADVFADAAKHALQKQRGLNTHPGGKARINLVVWETGLTVEFKDFRDGRPVYLTELVPYLHVEAANDPLALIKSAIDRVDEKARRWIYK